MAVKTRADAVREVQVFDKSDQAVHRYGTMAIQKKQLI
jgi:hypothetical protein